MAVKTIVSHATKSPIRQTSSITTQSTNIETAMVSNSTSSISEQEVSSSRLTFVRRSFKDQKFSEKVCKILHASWKRSTKKQYQSAWKQFFSWCSQRSCDPFSCSLNIISDYLVDLMASWKRSTKKQYQSAWKQFFSWCSQRSCDPFSCSLNIISDYLVDLFYKGLEYRTINSHRSEISMIHLPVDGICVGTHPFISRLMNGIFNLRHLVQDVFKRGTFLLCYVFKISIASSSSFIYEKLDFKVGYVDGIDISI